MLPSGAMEDGSGDALRHYHEATKHSYESVRMTPHFLDWDNQPLAFKLYKDVEQVALPDVSVSADGNTPGLGISELARLLFYSAGVTKKRRFAGGEMVFRAAACTGALYHIEVYVIAGSLDGLDAGVYHYGPKDSVLSRLRDGDWRRALVAATGDEPELSEAPAALVLTSTFWRNAWKYRARAYRHSFWDSGTMFANLEAIAAKLDVRAHLVLGFADEEVNRLIDVDSNQEAAVAIVAIGALGSHAEDGERGIPAAPGVARRLELDTVPLSRMEVDYPPIREAHRSSSLPSGDAARTWRGLHLSSRASVSPPGDVEAVIRRRGSSRRFERCSVEKNTAMHVIGSTLPAVDSDVPPLGDVYVIVNDVEGISSGSYFYPRDGAERGRLQLLESGEFRDQARHLDLEQDLAGDASVNVYVLASLDAMMPRYGDRGYRAAQLEGGVLGGRMYLASYAQGLGATGLTFFDDAVTDFFSPHARGKAVMFLLAFGVPAKRKVLFQH